MQKQEMPNIKKGVLASAMKDLEKDMILLISTFNSGMNYQKMQKIYEERRVGKGTENLVVNLSDEEIRILYKYIDEMEEYVRITGRDCFASN